jgi:flavorubredoxin
MQAARQVTRDVHVLPSEFPVPGLGALPVNAYVIKAREPVLVDAGLHCDADIFMDALESIIDPADLRWIYLTHPDPDHIGALTRAMQSAPKARLVTTYLGLGTLSLSTQVRQDRVYFLNPGEKLDVGDRSLQALRPPTFDSPATTAFYDSRANALFSSDCFGAVLPRVPDEAADLSENVLRDGQVLWATVDAPWLHKVRKETLAAELAAIRRMAPEIVFSAHLPPARSMTNWMLESFTMAAAATEFSGPSQTAFAAMQHEMASAAMRDHDLAVA